LNLLYFHGETIPLSHYGEPGALLAVWQVETGCQIWRVRPFVNRIFISFHRRLLETVVVVVVVVVVVGGRFGSPTSFVIDVITTFGTL